MLIDAIAFYAMLFGGLLLLMLDLFDKIDLTLRIAARERKSAVQGALVLAGSVVVSALTGNYGSHFDRDSWQQSLLGILLLGGIVGVVVGAAVTLFGVTSSLVRLVPRIRVGLVPADEAGKES